jgi:hypothetical protein|tara:strand:- start:1393 stop:1641 length:249 start_codon:yes stop_codon:yes gene_type:complete
MAKLKGSPKTGGRQAGTPNRINGNVKEMVLTALDGAGGVDYLIEQAQENPGNFLSLVGRVLPMQLAGSGDDGAITINVTLEQ